MRRVHLDHNATTPPDPAVMEAVRGVAARAWANPSSIHADGRDARAVLDESRYRLASALGCKPSEVVFTGGGTEANNLAVLGTARALRGRGRHVVASPVEHPSVREAVRWLERHEGFEVTWLRVDGDGRVDPAEAEAALRPDTVLVTVMAANNEVGTVQPVAAIGAACRARGIPFHVDAVQAFGKLPFASAEQFHADLVSLCAHKFHGPRGAGALYVRSPLRPLPVLLGGAQEDERRAGTENVAAIAGLVEAFLRFVPDPVFPPARMRAMTEALAAAASSVPGVHRRGAAADRLPNTVAFTVEGTDSIALLANLDLEGVCASGGSACAAGSLEPSHVLEAMGVPAAECNALVRLSLGRDTTDEDVAHACAVLPAAIARARG